MRVEKSIKNIKIGLISQIVLIILGFISRKIFLDSLGTEYLGVNGLLTNVLSAMVLIEGGIGISITYNLYKPLAENDEEQITALIKLFKNSYRVLAFIIFIISLALYPFVKNKMINGGEIQGLAIVYFIFVFRNIISYLFAYKSALINADQRGYVLARNNLIFQVISILFKIAILILFKSYLFYLIMDFTVFLLQNIVNSVCVNKRYPYIKNKVKTKINDDIKGNIVKNIKAMFIQNFGNYMIFSTDNILISSFISTAMVGLYSNYTMIMGQLASLLAPVIGGISNSVGNLLATESKEKSYEVFKTTFIISFWITSFSSIFLYNLLNPFISWWLGEEYLLSNFTFGVLIFNFYINGMRNTVGMFKAKAGLFSEDKYAAVIEGILNLIISIALVKIIGLPGIFLGTTFSYLLLSFWNQPRILFEKYFNLSVFKYFRKYLKYTVIALINAIITLKICNYISGITFISIILRGIVCVITVNVMYVLIFWNCEEFKYIKGNILRLVDIKKIRSKLKVNI